MNWFTNFLYINKKGEPRFNAEPCRFGIGPVQFGTNRLVWHDSVNRDVIICLYVDDMLIIGINMKGINETKKYLDSKFKMKDLGEADAILGIKVKKHSGGYALCQCHYIEKVLKKI